jgi:hypothetical protein
MRAWASLKIVCRSLFRHCCGVRKEPIRRYQRNSVIMVAQAHAVHTYMSKSVGNTSPSELEKLEIEKAQ